MNISFFANKLIILIFLTCLILLFTGRPDFLLLHSIHYVWDLGHILFFLIFAYYADIILERFPKTSYIKRCLLILGISLFFGILVEFIQSLMADRSADIYDILRNITGTLFGLFFLAPSRKRVKSSWIFIFQSIILLLILFSVIPLARSIMDEIIIRRQFPILSDFETPFETKRWIEMGNSKISIDNNVYRNGKASLKIVFNTKKYSGIGLKYFFYDWRNYDALEFSLFNPVSESLKIICRVHDSLHKKNNQKYADRFNRRLWIKTGWNDIRIPVSHILNAPKNREMDLATIRGFNIFVVRLPEPRIIYLDNIRLTKNNNNGI